MEQDLKVGVIGNGSWATALVKILTDNNNKVNWWIRNVDSIDYIKKRRHNPNYLSSAYLDVSLLTIYNDVASVVATSDLLIIAVPSAYIKEVLHSMSADLLKGKKILSAIKGLVPGPDVLLNDYMHDEFNIPIEDYFAVLVLVMPKKLRQRNFPISLFLVSILQ